MLRNFRLILWAAVAVAAAAAAVLLVGPSRQDMAETVAVRPTIGGPFELVAGDGRTVRDTDLHGRPFAIFFGFTRCPDICPTALFEMTGWIEQLGADAARMRFVFVTVDPERDTPALMQDYVGSFSDDILPLTGTAEQIAAVLQAYRVYARKVPLEGGDYTMDHSTMVYLMDEEGRYVSHIAYGESPERAVASLRSLLGS